MKNRIFLLALFISLHIIAQDIWIPKSGSSNSFELTTNEFKNTLQRLVTKTSDVELIDFPSPETENITFKVILNEVLSPELQQKFPDIHSFKGTSLDGKSLLTITCNSDTFNINFIYSAQPWKLENTRKNIYTLNQDKQEASRNFECNTVHKQTPSIAQKSTALQNFYLPTFVPNNQKRTLRFAVAVAGETSDYFINQAGLQNASDAQKKATVLLGIATSIENINVALERDLGVELQLIANSEDLIFLNKDTDPFSDVNTTSTARIADEANDYINATIGQNNFDLGHIITSPRNGAGGQAVVGGICSDFRANAITASSAPEGFGFDFTLFAHEIGHQLGGNHTQNANCQRNPSTAVEVSSGTTIMGYSGACGALDVQENSDPFFHSLSIDQILNNFERVELFETNCVFEKEFLSNNLPQVELLPNDYFIPVGTPFFLDVVATDADGDQLTYSWEQMDIDVGQSPPEADSPVGPQFRILNPSTSSIRDFPANIESTTYEVLPTVERQLSFNVLVRDGAPQGVAYSNITFVNTVGQTPFTISLPNNSNSTEVITYAQNEEINLSWSVGITNQSLINTQNVSIDLINGSTNESINLMASTPNDGNENVTIPLDFIGENFRFRINAINNIFYNVSNFFTIDSVVNENISITSSQDKIDNYLIFNIKKSSKLINDSEIIISFTDEISGEVLNFTTIGSEISSNGSNYQNLSEDSFIASELSDSFFIRVPLNTTNSAETADKIRLELTIINGTEITRAFEIGDILPLNLGFKDSIVLFPIPATDKTITIASKFTLRNEDFIDISVYDINGQLVSNYSISETEEQISIAGLSTGMYFLQLIKNGRDTANFKILVE